MNKHWNFPAGEVGVQLVDPPDNLSTPICLTLQGAASEDIMRLMMEIDAYRQAGYFNINLYLPYVPYGRQDRVTSPGTNFGLAAFCSILKTAKLHEILIVDPHSQVTVKQLREVCIFQTVVEQHELLEHLPIFDGRPKEDWVVVAPDKGARERAQKAALELSIPNVVTADKIRDPDTGHIVNISLDGTVTGKHVLVVDDICDGGRTFIELAKSLTDAASRTLFVTHGIFSQGFEVVAAAYNAVYTTDTFPRKPGDGVPSANIIPINQYYT